MQKEIFQKLSDSIEVPRRGDIVEGLILAQEGVALFVDLGPGKVGIVYGEEYQRAKDIFKKIKIGDKISAKITETENEEGFIELSLKEAIEETSWRKIKELKEKGETIKVKILKVNKGGLISEILGIPAFLPTSQLSSENYPRVPKGDKSKILNKLQSFIDKEIAVKILDFDENASQVILTEHSEESENVQKILQSLEVGDVVEGVISGIVDFGAFVKFSPPQKENLTSSFPLLEGLVHISELDWQLIENPVQVVKVGEKVRAKVIDITQGRVSLSLKALKKDPWQELDYKPQDVIKGKVVKFNPFGAFIQVILSRQKGQNQPKIQGLIHISEFGSEKKMREMLLFEKEYNFQILSFQPQRHWMSLRLK
ncbi:MAG: 30S ribosomal protein S1 [Candidatus Nealsonbacteria bacterium CG_4_9_14_3_um_filter_35_11]|uniref:30S ribosomal protein S1 n=2 Tax=Candidatus Nealsoniibacteriota TaxID=1817911 RepID=A0A2M7DAW4_9BACT|nr:MAG: 30S ribosomal protein S1 [Candidatus Nealsonbacteria bacterium CG11_big_fil_rev_8_21_14_0_20_35_11]PIV45574.1 MAG: 30S ribosomal protein S1 [Candidatus Nealsonbacteria bacterium CG02_land_8_20_14_3_00_34_20]PIW92618.1 MAG: 30S ribosomal protein S1 [Candidatus Nealsonbacteria bacterium CG_4_8_14_3_um_filter_34_13]PIZ89909.1 MAG: 30S ribosomal protein S1 [Candidatus Nealsonbacteria bacterium CG_4_10_14_0_2_um_filter_35_20]PJA84791.1 MAG: 30S ribosomal protein S1 [Candidatus Nealsonbacteri